MLSVFLGLSKYFLALFMALFVLSVYRGATIKDEGRRIGNTVSQYTLMFLIHFLSYICIYIFYADIKYILFFIVQAVYISIIILFYRMFYPKSSALLVNNMCILLIIGFIMISRLNFDKSVKQFTIAIIGSAISFFIPVLLKKVKSFRNFGWLYCIAGLCMLIFMLFGNKVFGAYLTLTIGPVTIQPAEFVKILYVMFIASFFNKSTSFVQTALVSVLAALHVIVLVLSTDLGAALIFFVVYLAMLFVATKNSFYSLFALAGGSAAAVCAYKVFGHVKARVDVWLNPWPSIDSTGYQITQSLFAIGMGSWFGYGLCQGMPAKIPVAEKDFMFSAITEEFGLIFSISMLLVCLNNLILMMNIASRCKTLFYRLVAVGLGVTYGFQVFLTVGGAIKFIPMTGVTIPFVSYGGSSLLSSLIMFALINGMYNMRQDEGDKDGSEKEFKKEYSERKEKSKRSGKAKKEI